MKLRAQVIQNMKIMILNMTYFEVFFSSIAFVVWKCSSDPQSSIGGIIDHSGMAISSENKAMEHFFKNHETYTKLFTVGTAKIRNNIKIC